MTDERSERLRRRRESNPSGDATDATRDSRSSESANAHDADAQNTESKSAQSPQQSLDAPVKEQQVGTYMYLPESQTKNLRRVYNILKAKYEFEFDEEFEKNRHFYPLVIQYGLDRLDGMDPDQIQACLQDLYE